MVYFSCGTRSGAVLIYVFISVNVKAFHAEGSQTDIHPNSIIKFGKVKMNVGGCYNPTLSVFTCTDGLYVFYVTISSNGGVIWYEIVQDGKQRLSGFTGHPSYSVSTHLAMIRCHPRSHIWVKQSRAYKQGMYWGHSQFGGFQIV